MADTKTSGAGLRLNSDFRKINPLICTDGDTLPVQSALGFVSTMLTLATDGEVTLSVSDSLGLAFILDTCKAALENMPKSEVDHG